MTDRDGRRPGKWNPPVYEPSENGLILVFHGSSSH